MRVLLQFIKHNVFVNINFMLLQYSLIIHAEILIHVLISHILLFFIYDKNTDHLNITKISCYSVSSIEFS